MIWVESIWILVTTHNLVKIVEGLLGSKILIKVLIFLPGPYVGVGVGGVAVAGGNLGCLCLGVGVGDWACCNSLILLSASPKMLRS